MICKHTYVEIARIRFGGSDPYYCYKCSQCGNRVDSLIRIAEATRDNYSHNEGED